MERIFKPCTNTMCNHHLPKHSDGSGCLLWTCSTLLKNGCMSYQHLSNPTPEERLPLDPKELSTVELTVVILDRNVSLWYRKEALTEYDTREGRIDG